MSDLLRAKEVARRLGVSTDHVYGLLDRNQLPHVRIPGRNPGYYSRRVDPIELERWINERRTSAHQEAS